IAIPFFKLPVGIASGAVDEGFFQGIIPIGYIVMMSVLLYKITVESGQFLTIQDIITNISQDQRIQVLLIVFAFNEFLEGAAG
ncbi:L-lactate permease, partial [Staphylococcus aureus]|nr:L-lactate permease [Staphylococcus aureus]